MRAHAKQERKEFRKEKAVQSVLFEFAFHEYKQSYLHIAICTPKIINSNLTDFIVSNLRADKY